MILCSGGARAESLPPMHQFALANGLQVVVIEDPRIPAVSHNLLFKVGAADDPYGKSGLAHYLEHMLFQGTERYGPNEYSKLLAAHGGQHNAFTSADYTGYWANIAKKHLPLAMELEADRLQFLNPTPENFAREKQVILEERRMRVDNDPAALFDEQFEALLYLRHPYGTPVIGWPDEMAALTRRDVMDYYRRYYHAGNALLVLSGDITLEEAEKLAEHYYGGLPARRESLPPRPAEPPQWGPRHFEMRHPQVQQAAWQQTYLAPSYGWHRDGQEEQLLPLLLAEYILGGSKSGRLYRTLVEQKGIGVEAGANYNPFRQGPGEFTLYVTPLRPADLPIIEQVVQEEIRNLTAIHPSAEEVARAKAQLIASHVYLQDGLQPLANAIGHLWMLGLPLDYYARWEKSVRAVTPAQISAALNLLDKNHSVTGSLLPETQPHPQ